MDVAWSRQFPVRRAGSPNGEPAIGVEYRSRILVQATLIGRAMKR